MLHFGYCNLSVVPVRETPSDLSQMTTQLLFGDVFLVLEKEKNWLRIQNAYDDYIGWIDSKQQLPIDEETFHRHSNAMFTNRLQGDLYFDSEKLTLVPASSFQSAEAFRIGKSEIVPSLPLFSVSTSKIDEIKDIAIEYLNAPYLWGGKTPFGIDCSGFTQSVYKMAGLKLWRDASQQAMQGNSIHFISEARCGDLIFFDNAEGKIVHVGIFLGQNKIIHASGKVRIDTIDHQGIFNEETKSYSHSLRLIKTFAL
jgi:cell wall-associated NlpC family hydrolase